MTASEEKLERSSHPVLRFKMSGKLQVMAWSPAELAIAKR